MTVGQATQPRVVSCDDPTQKLHLFPREARSLVVGQVAAFGGCSQHVEDGIVAIQRRADHGDSFDAQLLGRQIAAPAIDDDAPVNDLDGNSNTSFGNVGSKLRLLLRRHPGNAVRFGMKSQ